MTKLTEKFPILPAVEAALTAVLHQPIHISHVEQLSEAERRNLLLRCTLAEAGGDVPATVIVKQVRAENYAPDDVANNWDTQRFYQGWVGLATFRPRVLMRLQAFLEVMESEVGKGSTF